MLTQDLDTLIQSVSYMDKESGIPQSIYVIEEMSELTKELTKQIRHKGDDDKIIDETCDVFVTLSVLLRSMDVTEEEIYRRMAFKCRRALDRYENSGEV